MSSSRSNSAADPADEATEAIDGLSIASPSVESIRGGEILDVNEAFAKWAWDICKYADKDLDKEVGNGNKSSVAREVFSPSRKDVKNVVI